MRLLGAVIVAATCTLAACSVDEETTATGSPVADATNAAAPADATTTASPTTGAAADTTAPARATTATPTTANVATTSPPTSVPEEPLRVLVTNDDGYGAEGIDAVVTYLVSRGDFEVTVAAPSRTRAGPATTRATARHR